MRYRIVEGSQSVHCCFGYTVVDTSKPYLIHGKQYENQFIAVCECFYKEEADLVCRALNAFHIEGERK